MCHAQLDPKLLMQDAAERYRAAQPVVAEQPQASDGIPPELMGGARGIWARLIARLSRRPKTQTVPIAAE